MNGRLTRRRRRYAWAGVPVLLVIAAFPAIHVRGQTAGAETSRQLPHQWRYWKYFREIRVPATSAPRLVALLVPRSVYARAERGLADLRIIDERGSEVPYAKITFTGSTRTTFLPSHSLHGRSVPGRYRDFVLDLGRHPEPCNFLSVSAAPTAANLAVLAEIDSSEDGIHWHELRKNGALFGSRALEHSTNPVLYFPETTTHFLRLRIFYHGGKFSLRTMAAGRKATTPADRIAVTDFLPPSAASTPSVTLWQISLDGAIPADQVDFETTQPEFSRGVRVFVSRHGGTWRRVGLGMISRVHHDGEVDARMGVDFPAVRSRLWRVELRNESDPPLANLKLRLSMTPRRIIFWQRPGRSYLLLYGQSEAPEPEYDLAQTVPTNNLRAAPLLASAEALQTNLAWADPRPWSEKHAAVLWLAAIVAALLLGLASIRAIRRPRPA